MLDDVCFGLLVVYFILIGIHNCYGMELIMKGELTIEIMADEESGTLHNTIKKAVFHNALVFQYYTKLMSSHVCIKITQVYQV